MSEVPSPVSDVDFRIEEGSRASPAFAPGLSNESSGVRHDLHETSGILGADCPLLPSALYYNHSQHAQSVQLVVSGLPVDQIDQLESFLIGEWGLGMPGQGSGQAFNTGLMELVTPARPKVGFGCPGFRQSKGRDPLLPQAWLRAGPGWNER